VLTEKLKSFQSFLFSLPDEQRGEFERLAAGASDWSALAQGLARTLGEAPGLLTFAKDLSQHAESLIQDLEEDRENLGKFRIVIFGKVNCGKSYLANLLAGFGVQKAAPKDLGPKSVFRAWTPEGSEVELESFAVRATECTRQIQWCDLGGLRIVDLPGLDSLSPENHARAKGYVGQADLVVYLTNSDAALRGSDYRHMLGLSQKRKRMIVAISQCDERAGYDSDDRIRMGSDKIAEQSAFVKQVFKDPRSGLSEVLPGLEIVPISALLARIGLEKSKRRPEEGAALERASGMEELFDAILDVVRTEGAPLRLLNPLGRTFEVLSEAHGGFVRLSSGLRAAERFLSYKKNQLAKHKARTAALALEEAYPLMDLLVGARPRLDRFLDYALSLDGFLAHLAPGAKKDEVSEAEKRKTLSQRFRRDVLSAEEVRKRLEKLLGKWESLAEKKLALFEEDYEAGAKRVAEQPASEVLADLWERWGKEKLKANPSSPRMDVIAAALSNLEAGVIKEILPEEGGKPDKRAVKAEAVRSLKSAEEEIKKALAQEAKGHVERAFARHEEVLLDFRLALVQSLLNETGKVQARTQEIKKALEASREAIRERYRPPDPDVVVIPPPHKAQEAALSRG